MTVMITQLRYALPTQVTETFITFASWGVTLHRVAALDLLHYRAAVRTALPFATQDHL